MTSPDDRIEIRRSVVSVSRFSNKSSLDSLIRHLRSIRAHGRLTVDMANGGVNSIQFEARTMLNGHEHVEIQFTPIQKPLDTSKG